MADMKKDKTGKYVSGEGLKSIQTTSVFRMVNFELYAKPNMMIMAFGVVGILMSTAYLAYMKSQVKKKKAYIAIAEDGSESLQLKRSKWD